MPQLTATQSRQLQTKDPILTRDTNLALSVLRLEDVVAFDIETSGLSPWLDRIAVLTLNGQKSGMTAVLHVRGSLPRDVVSFFNDPSKLFIGHNIACFDLLFLALAGVDIHLAKYYDTLIGEQVCKLTNRKDVRFSLKASALRQLGIQLKKDADHSGWMNPSLTDLQVEYCADDVKFIHELRTAQHAKAADKGLERAIETEMLLVPIIAQMTLNGMPIDLGRLREHLEGEEERSNDALYGLWDVFGPINFGSSQQVLTALSSIGLDLRSSSVEVLKDLIQKGADQAGYLRDIIQVRQGKKRINQYSPAWVKQYVAPDGKIHPRWWVCVSANTLVQMPCDRTKFPRGVPIPLVKPGQLIYSYTEDGRLCLRRALRVERTGQKPTYKLRARTPYSDNWVELHATADHQIRLTSGEWRRLDSLRVGDHLTCMPGMRVMSDGRMYFTKDRFVQGLPRREHDFIATQMEDLPALPRGYIVHHTDENPLNNDPANLEILTIANHGRLHNGPSDEEVVAMLNGSADPLYSPKQLRRTARRRGLLDASTFSNHDVVSVEYLGVEEVWDIEVEDTHCFIADGVAVHNCGTDTGRMSGSDPNMQQWPVNMRWVIASPVGQQFLMADYKSAEVVVAAALSNDRALLDAIKAGGDLHRNVGSSVFGCAPDAITSDQRKLAKAMNFCLLFGGWYETFYSYARLAGSKITLEEAKQIEEQYFATFTGVAAMKYKASRQSQRGGPVMMHLPTGLKRNLMPSAKGRVAKTQILNTAVQGTAAAGMKYALIDLYRKGVVQAGIGASVHDELAGSFPEADVEDVAREIEESMIAGMKTAVGNMYPDAECPIGVEVKIDQDWRKE